MKLSISNIAWDESSDHAVYEIMNNRKYCGIEIAPTRIVAENPYEHIDKIKKWYNDVKNNYCFEVSSIQSIWNGRNENIFSSKREREVLIEYTKKVISLAREVNCNNIVFGCPKNRNISENYDINFDLGIEFIQSIGSIAEEFSTTIAIEAIPSYYGTNFLNSTQEVIDCVRKLKMSGVKINLDLGAMIINGESISTIEDNIDIINHVHISEPDLCPIKNRPEHKELVDLLNRGQYSGYISIEMRKSKLNEVLSAVEYVSDLFVE